jgi:hypothetical protein
MVVSQLIVFQVRIVQVVDGKIILQTMRTNQNVAVDGYRVAQKNY